ncbi:DUF294 nucleotidyltransferase-like domain-containing protein [Tumebacillus flagellatus]|uniref:Signal transduction protein n=1 Tax=Tumebacillus flagellatus TaxID=1157490 RepID=A0A074LWV9_9BACL|nr:DUF294 nucleotidyltransferase-like domain-containing protein [Tumebacillus flagellatus]KEO84583.1 hypothetical protein EL26_03440 [Tumebacillus flagellatus]
MQPDQADTWTSIRQRLDTAERLDDLRRLRELMPGVAERWSVRGMPTAKLCAIVNLWHDLLMRRTLDFALQDAVKNGLGTPPAPFCWLVLGSGGRQEMTLHPDQDNGLVYRSLASDEQGRMREGAFFQRLGERGNARLEEVGYPFCDGFVMAANPRWNGSVEQWKTQFREYADFPDWSNTRLLLIASDVRPLAGDASLAHELRKWLVEQVPQMAYLKWQTADRCLSQKTGLDFRDRFRTELWGERAGQLNLKDGGYLPLVNSVRLWALAHGIVETNTGGRIAELVARGVWTAQQARPVQEANEYLHHLRLWGNYVRPDALPVGEVLPLKSVLKSVRVLQKRTAKFFVKPRSNG